MESGRVAILLEPMEHSACEEGETVCNLGMSLEVEGLMKDGTLSPVKQRPLGAQDQIWFFPM